jgi:predicted ATP-grasp superfamily ATP-dependent carboligase
MSEYERTFYLQLLSEIHTLNINLSIKIDKIIEELSLIEQCLESIIEQMGERHG